MAIVTPRTLAVLIVSIAATYVTVNKFAVQPDSIAVPFIMIGYGALITIIMWFFGTFLSSRF